MQTRPKKRKREERESDTTTSDSYFYKERSPLKKRNHPIPSIPLPSHSKSSFGHSLPPRECGPRRRPHQQAQSLSLTFLLVIAPLRTHQHPFIQQRSVYSNRSSARSELVQARSGGRGIGPASLAGAFVGRGREGEGTEGTETRGTGCRAWGAPFVIGIGGELRVGEGRGRVR